MKTVNYILVDDVHPKAGSQVLDNRYVLQPGDAIVIQHAVSLTPALVPQLVRLRRRFPDAKILGASEIDGKNIRVSEDMNTLRRALSDCP